MADKKKPEPGDANFRWGVDQPVNVDQLLADAKLTGLKANRFSRDVIDPQPSVMPNQFLGGDTGEQNGFATEQGSVFDSPMEKLARLGRQVVRPIPGALKGAAGVGSFLPGPVGMGSRAVLGAESGYDLAQGGVEGLTEHPVRSALNAAGVVAGLSSLKGLKTLIQGGGAETEALANLLGGQARAYEGPGAPSRPKIRLTPLEPASAPQPQGAQSFADAVREQARQPKQATNYRAQSLLENPASEAFRAREFDANKPLADDVFGAHQDLLGKDISSPSLAALKSRWGYRDPVAGEPVFTAPPEGASTGIPGEFPPGPAAPGFSVGPKSTLPESTGSPLADAAQRAAQRRVHLQFLKDLAGSAR